MGWQEFIGYLGSFLMFSTFWMKRMIPLRIAGISANCAMITYAAAAGLYPIMAVQTLMLPLNMFRLWQMRNLVNRVAAVGNFGPDALVPFMKKESFTAGHVLFKAGDASDKMYLVKSGTIRLKEFDVTMGPGDLFGEIGLLSTRNRRTATAEVAEDTQVLALTRDDVEQLFFQEPEFGFFLMELVTERLIGNLDTPADQQLTPEGGSRG